MWNIGRCPPLVAAFCLCSVFGCSLVSSDYVQVQYIETQEGRDLFVDCNVTDSNNMTVFWTKNNTHRTFIKFGKRLLLKDIKQNNAGYYVCHTLETSLPAYNRTDVNKTVNVVMIAVKGDSANNENSHNDVGDDNGVGDNDDDSGGDDYSNTQLIVVLTLSTVATIGVVLFLVYLMKYRKRRTLIYNL